ncbi:MAG: RidA family protein [Bryobacterales bacterium]|nr:RidA family protein [Bryobacterales bacterium]
MTVLDRLQGLGLQIPEPPRAVGAYEPFVVTGSLVLTSGQLPWRGGRMMHAGKLGQEVTVEEGYEAARQAGLNAIAQLQAAVGDLEKVRLVRVEGYVHCGEGFREHPKVLDGASELFLAVFGDKGKHVRIALGIKDMPLNAPVQIAVWAELG